MSWAKIDDALHAHPKVARAWKAHPRAVGLHLLAVSYCSAYLTDGRVDLEFVEGKMPVVRERAAVTQALVAAGLWVEADDGWLIHDWHDFNPTRAEVLERRARDADRKAKGRRSQSDGNPSGVPPESARNPLGVRQESARPGSDGPDPTRPDNSKSNGSRTEERCAGADPRTRIRRVV